jgi:hypothetical protein
MLVKKKKTNQMLVAYGISNQQVQEMPIIIYVQ